MLSIYLHYLHKFNKVLNITYKYFEDLNNIHHNIISNLSVNYSTSILIDILHTNQRLK